MPYNNPLVSIILPVYNGEKTLGATLNSLINQTFPHYELIIGIDGTNDDSKAIALSFNDPRIKIIEHPKNLGLANNVNALIVAANKNSSFIAMAEQDDIYVAERIEWQVGIMEEHPNVGLVSGIAEFKSAGSSVLFPGVLDRGEQFPHYQKLFKYLYEYQLKVVNTCMMLRKKVHEDENLVFRNTYGNFNVDWNYILRFSLVSEVYGIPKKLVSMNRNQTNSSVTRDKNAQHKASRQLLKDFKREFPDLISRALYAKALKQHRKIELGHNSKFGIVCKSLCYFIRYQDVYFLKYTEKRIKNFLIKKDE
jgi:glycosyltransferase involved in cell wall biosynthesis